MKKIIIALGVLGLVAIVAFQQWRSRRPVVTLKGVVGGEKVSLMEDPQLAALLEKNAQLKLTVTKSGSLEMAERDPGLSDFLFPGSQIATEIFKAKRGSQFVESQTLLRSPLVIYSWDNTTQALIKQNIVQVKNNTYFITDMPRLVKLITDGKSWADIGLPYYGKVKIHTTNPASSNSGAMFAGLLANILAGPGQVADETNLEPQLPALRNFFKQLGFLENSSSDLFADYLATGEGARPMVVGYENQMVEYALQKPAVWQQSQAKVRVLYPAPTCWSAHELIILNPSGRELIKALSTPEAQQLAWGKHGFRPGEAAVAINLQIVGNIGIPAQLDQISPLPNSRTMARIISAVGK